MSRDIMTWLDDVAMRDSFGCLISLRQLTGKNSLAGLF